jgi:type IV pilus assembly protein PilC
MSVFTYEATSRQGQRVTGTREAESRDDVATFLHDQGLVVITISENVGIDFKKLGSIQIGGIPLSERVIFVKQLSTMLSAGLPIIQALDILVQQTKNSSLKDKLARVYKSVEAGTSLAEAFKKDKTIFNNLELSLLVAGEKSGTLNEIMAQIAVDMEKSKSLRGKIIGAMIYPVIIMVVMVIVLIVMLVFMVPSVKSLYADFGVSELPGITQFLVNISEAVTNPFGAIAIILIIIFSIVGLRYYYATYQGRRAIDRLLLKMPVFGSLLNKVQITQFARLLSLLMKSGVPIVESMRTVADAIGNTIYKDLILQAADEVLKGNPMAVPLAKDNIMPLVMLKMIATGEETGKLDKVLSDMAAYYEAEVEETTSNLTKLMEPFILLTVGVMVGFMAIAIYLPLYSIGQYIQ